MGTEVQAKKNKSAVSNPTSRTQVEFPMKLPLLLTSTTLCAWYGAANDCSSRYSACLMIYAPVCGSDGKTYSNECFLNAAKCSNPTLTKLYDGKCLNPCITPCTREYIPVCGSDGKTYPNRCEFRNGQCTNKLLTIAYDGECHPNACKDTMCLMIYLPVCGSDGHTYSNDCVFKNAQCRDPSLVLVKTGACDEDEKPTSATNESLP